MKKILFVSVLVLPVALKAQNKNAKRFSDRTIHLSIAPGLSTNGINLGRYRNLISFNLTSSYSAGYGLLEISGLSSFAKYSSSGLAVSGLVNIVGGDGPATKTKKEEEESKADVNGIQVTTLLNFVRGDITGVQISAGINHSRYNLYGMQAGLINVNYGFAFGVQASALCNVASYISGLQASALINISKTNLFGFQLGVINYVKTIHGPKSKTNYGNGVQIGLINFSNEMDGWQFGLVNVSKRSTKGTQVGLINFYRGNVVGAPIGLINLGRPYGTFRIWAADLFLTNYGIGLGSKKVQNTLYYSYNPVANIGEPTRAVGYGIDRIFILSDQRQAEAGMYVTVFKKGDEPKMLFSPKVSACFHINRGIYWMFGLSTNVLWKSETAARWIDNISFKSKGSQIWPGFQLGLLTR